MIKLNYNGFQLEVDTADEARDIIQGTRSLSSRDEHPVRVNVVKEKRVYKTGKKGMKAPRWTREEMNKIFSELDRGQTAGAIARDSFLRANHKKGGIKQMVYHVRQKVAWPRVSMEVADMIKSRTA